MNVASPQVQTDATALVNRWFGPANEVVKKDILSKLKHSDAITSMISSLQLAEYITSNQFGATQTISDADFELNLFKAYLLLNEEQDNLEIANLPKLPANPADREASLSLGC